MIAPYLDRYGIVHHTFTNGNPETSENGPMYTALWAALSETYCCSPILKALRYDYIKIWLPTPVTSPLNVHLSHDNKTGIACMAFMEDNFKGSPTQWLKEVPIISQGCYHPRDIIFYGYLKYPWLFFPFIWVTSIAMIISCGQTYKVRGDKKMLRTDGKLLTFLRCHTVRNRKFFNLSLTWKICNFLVRNNSKFGTWGNVSKIYFGISHPITWRLESEPFCI